jgi:hypothetical protein
MAKALVQSEYGTFDALSCATAIPSTATPTVTSTPPSQSHRDSEERATV